MATTDGKTFKLVASETDHDNGTTAETVTHQFRLTSGVVLPSVTTIFHRGTDESGRSTDLEETAPTAVARDMSWTGISMVADDFSVPFWMFWASHGGDNTGSGAGNATSVPNQLGVTSLYEHNWTGPQTNGTFCAPTVQALGKEGTSDDDLNRIIHNCAVEQFELTGQRKGVLSVNLSLRPGGFVESAGAGTAGTFTRNHVFNFAMAHLLTSDTLGFAEGAAKDTAFGTQITDAQAVTSSELNATVSSLTSALQSFSLRFRQTPDTVRSYAPGNVDSSDAGIVPDSDDWIPGNDGAAQAELEMTFTQTANETIEGLMQEYEAGTRRPFELWVSPQVATDTDYSGVRVTFGEMHPVSWEEVPNGFGAKDVRVVYRAGYHTTDGYGWRVLASFADSTELGL